MAPLLAARRKHLTATLGFHAYAEAVRLGAAALARLICALWQSNLLCCTNWLHTS
jgi:hypothetical protein